MRDRKNRIQTKQKTITNIMSKTFRLNIGRQVRNLVVDAPNPKELVWLKLERADTGTHETQWASWTQPKVRSYYDLRIGELFTSIDGKRSGRSSSRRSGTKRSSRSSGVCWRIIQEELADGRKRRDLHLPIKKGVSNGSTLSDCSLLQPSFSMRHARTAKLASRWRRAAGSANWGKKEHNIEGREHIKKSTKKMSILLFR